MNTTFQVFFTYLFIYYYFGHLLNKISSKGSGLNCIFSNIKFEFF